MADFEFSRSPDGAIVRRTRVSGQRIYLGSEIWDAKQGCWRLDARLLEEEGLEELGEAEARAAIGSESLTAVSPDLRQTPSAGGERERWLNARIAETAEYIAMHGTGHLAVDLMFGAPGDADYDYVFDEVRYVRGAYRTAEALAREREERTQLAERRRAMWIGEEEDPLGWNLFAVALHLQEVTLPELGSLADVREKHLEAAVKAALGERYGTSPRSAVEDLEDWPSLGRSAVDVVVDRHPHPRHHLIEVKWCRDDTDRSEDKVYEAIWDLFKMAIAVRKPDVISAHLVTACSEEMWERAFCRDIFDGGVFSPEELCDRLYPSGAQRRGWDWLLEGGHDRYPEHVPAQIETVRVAGAQVEDAERRWVVRAVRVEPRAGDDLPFIDGWPHGNRPPDAKHPRDIAPAP